MELGVGRTRSSSNEMKRTLRIFFRCSGGRVVDAIVNYLEPGAIYWASNFDLITTLLLTATSAKEQPLNPFRTGVQHQG